MASLIGAGKEEEERVKRQAVYNTVKPLLIGHPRGISKCGLTAVKRQEKFVKNKKTYSKVNLSLLLFKS